MAKHLMEEIRMPNCMTCKREGCDVSFSNSGALADHEILMHPDTLSVDEMIIIYAAKLEDIYNGRTAGDHTFTGVLSEYTRELLNQAAPELFTSIPECGE